MLKYCKKCVGWTIFYKNGSYTYRGLTKIQYRCLDCEDKRTNTQRDWTQYYRSVK